jgi:hypothetical protein
LNISSPLCDDKYGSLRFDKYSGRHLILRVECRPKPRWGVLCNFKN